MNTRSSRIVGALITAVAVVGLAGCAGAAPAASPTPTPTADSLEGSITVFAAASLKGTFTELAEQFESAHPGTTVELNFAGSADLVTQITEGAPADVFASADEKNMAKLDGRRPGRRRPRRLRHERARDRGPAGQSRGHRDVRRPRGSRA